MTHLAPVHNVSLKVLRSIVLHAYGRGFFLVEEPTLSEERLISIEPITNKSAVTGFDVRLPEMGEYPEIKGVLSLEAASHLVVKALTNQISRLGGTIAGVTWHAPEDGQPAFMPFACVRINKGEMPEMAA